jgi:hypothetical protein
MNKRKNQKVKSETMKILSDTDEKNIKITNF